MLWRTTNGDISSYYMYTTVPIQFPVQTIVGMLCLWNWLCSNIVPYNTGCDVKELPRLHHVKQLRKELNTHVKPICLDPPYMGSYRHIRALVSATLETTVNREKLVSAYGIYLKLTCLLFIGSQLKKTTNPPSGKVVLKLSGDGTSFSSTSSFVFLSSSFPTLGMTRHEKQEYVATHHVFMSVA